MPFSESVRNEGEGDEDNDRDKDEDENNVWICVECGTSHCLIDSCLTRVYPPCLECCRSGAWQDLRDAVRRNDLDSVSRFRHWKEVVNYKEDVIHMDEEGFIHSRRDWTILHECVLRNKPHLIANLAASSAPEIDLKCGEGCTPLALCASLVPRQREDAQTVVEPVALALIAGGAHIEAHDSAGRTPLHRACLSGNLSMFYILMQHGANVNARDSDGDTPLHAWVEGWDANFEYNNHGLFVILQLLQRGADINAKNERFGETPLHVACREGLVSVVDILLQKGAGINTQDKRGNSPLHTACYWGHETTASRLARAGAYIHVRDWEGCTPLHVACQKGNLGLIRTLLEHGADRESRDENGNTPLILACQNNHLEVVHFLLMAGAQINTGNDRKRTPLHEACKKASLALVDLLLEFGASISALDGSGFSPLTKACARREDQIDMVTHLAHQGADINTFNCHGRSPLHEACFEGNWQVATFLIQQGANVNASDKEGDTPLMELLVRASLEHDAHTMEMAQVLLEAGAQVNAVNGDGKNPLGMATSLGDFEMVQLLLAHGAAEDNDQVEMALIQASIAKFKDIVRLLVPVGILSSCCHGIKGKQ